MEERHGWGSMKTLGRVLLILILGAAPAWAALGEPESSVSADGQVLRGQIRDEVHEGYRLHQITDANGAVQEVRGPGVVGEQPVLQPGNAYQYTSGAALRTPSGIMTGKYEMTTPQGERFPIDIPTFSLDSPDQVKRPN